MALVARTEGDPLALAGDDSARRSGASIAEQPIYELSTMDQILARAVFLPRLSTTLLALFAVAALLLAALGIYGVLSYSVTERTREIGLRMALGATGGRTVGLVVQNSLLLMAGRSRRARGGDAPGAFDGRDSLRHRPVRSAVVRPGGADPGAVGLGASLVPALRATRVDPMVALRESAG